MNSSYEDDLELVLEQQIALSKVYRRSVVVFLCVVALQTALLIMQAAAYFGGS